MPLHRVESVICNVTLWCDVAKTQSGVAFLLLTFIWLLHAAGRVGEGWWGVLEVRLTGPLASSGCRNGKMTLS